MGKGTGRTRKAAPPVPDPAATATAPSQEVERRAPWRGALAPGLVVLLAVLAYAPTLGNGFAFDDTIIIGANQLIKSFRNVPRMITSDYWASVERPDLFSTTRLYRPLVIFSFALNHAVGGVKPVGYHAINLLLHAGVSLAVYGVGRRLGLGRAGAALAGALFAVHPLHTEVVAGIVGRAELLMALGVLLGFAAYRGVGSLARLGSLAAFALGLLAKEQAMVLPGLLLLADWLALRPGSGGPGGWARLRRLLPRATLLRLLPYLGILGGYLLLRAWVLGGGMLPDIELLDNPLAHVAPGPRLLTALAVAGRYLTLSLWPAPLAPDYSYNQIPLATSLFEGRVLLALLLWAALLALGVRALRRGPSAAAFAVGFTTLTFLPAANLLVPIGTIMGERLFYLPSAGLCWLAGLGWEALWGRIKTPRLRLAAWAALGVLLLACTVQALRYGRVWRDDFTLFSYAVRVVPESAKVHFNLGSFLLEKKEDKERTLFHLRRSVEIIQNAGAWDALGRAYLEMKRWDEAAAAFREANAFEPKYPHSYNNLGLAYTAAGRWDDAMAAFRRAVALKPDLAQAHRNLADVYDQRGWTEAALAERSLEITPTDPLAWLQAGTTFLRLGWPAEALRAFAQAVHLAPTLPEAHLRLAQAHDLLRHPAEAAAAYEALLRLRPALPAIHRRLAELYSAALPDPAKAAAHRRQAEGAGGGKQ